MAAQFQFFTLSLLCLVASVTLAGPPRFDDVPGPAANQIAKPVATADDAAKPTATDAAVTDSTPITQLAPPTTKATAVETSKSDHSIFTWGRTTVPLEQTSKSEEALVPTHEFHKNVPEILQQGEVQYFAPGYRGTWLTQSSKTLCSLTQPIPHYGYAEFRQGTNISLQFLLIAANPPAGSGVVQLQSEPPVWSHYTQPTNLGLIELDEGEHAMTASTDWAQRILSDLTDGQQTSLQFYNGADASRDTKITLSAINFKTGLEGFDKCRAQLLRYDDQETKFTVLQFNADSTRLSKAAIRQLDGILEIVTIDPGVKGVDIVIYSLNKELVQYSFRLATRRAQAVRDYLMSKGVSEEKLKISIYTQKKSKFDQQGIKPDQVQIVLNRDKKKKG